jgi:hypothetical protein
MTTGRGMLSPPRSLFHPPQSPPLSESVLKLQKLGLELGSSTSNPSLRIPSSQGSAATSVSDLDKPLPLEPREIGRRTSSVYSIQTTISGIIDMYGGVRDDNSDYGYFFNDPQSYRDTVAPLLARRLSLTHSTWVPPMPQKLRTSVSTPIMRVDPHKSMVLRAHSNNAPSFAEFSRNLRERRTEIASPFSTESFEQHRQDALEKLAPPSPRESLEALGVVQEPAQSFLPGPMSGRITDVIATEYIPAPLDLSRASRILLSPQEAARNAQQEPLETPSQPRFQQPDSNQSWGKVMDMLGKGKSAGRREQDGVMKLSSDKYSPVKTAHLRKSPERSSGGSSIPQRASNFMSAISRPISSGNKMPTPAKPPRRQKQLAVKSTPYQEFGADVFLPPKKQEKKRQREEKKRQMEMEQERKKHERNRSSGTSKGSKTSDFSGAYHSGQYQIVGVLQGARQRLSRSASEKRRDKLRKNIFMVTRASDSKKDKKGNLGGGKL